MGVGRRSQAEGAGAEKGGGIGSLCELIECMAADSDGRFFNMVSRALRDDL